MFENKLEERDLTIHWFEYTNGSLVWVMYHSDHYEFKKYILGADPCHFFIDGTDSFSCKPKQDLFYFVAWILSCPLE